MSTFFPLLYSAILFFSISFLTYSILVQIRKTQNLEQRLSKLQKKISQYSTSYEDYYKLGQVYLTKKLYNQAIIAFKQALRYWDYSDKIGLCSLYNTIGFVYFKLNLYEYAIYYYKQATNYLPDYTLSLCNLAFAYEKKKNYNQALKVYEIIFFFDKNHEIAKPRSQKVLRLADKNFKYSLLKKNLQENEYNFWT